MFDRIAHVYDRLNTVMSAGMDEGWRVRAADEARLSPGDRALDVACGTGRLTMELVTRVGQQGSVTGLDFSEEMLALARRQAPEIDWRSGDALELPFPDAEFDAVTVGFAVRNFEDLAGGLREMRRVTRPGGRVVVLEFTEPKRPPLSWFFNLWFDRIVPVLGRVAGDPDAYTYLPNSVRRFPGPETLAGELAATGLTNVRWIVTGGGIVTIHIGTVPPAG